MLFVAVFGIRDVKDENRTEKNRNKSERCPHCGALNRIELHCIALGRNRGKYRAARGPWRMEREKDEDCLTCLHAICYWRLVYVDLCAVTTIASLRPLPSPSRVS
jgi:hypothetical protein